MKRPLTIMLAASALIIQTSFAGVSDADAIRTIVGEASNQGERGMLAIAGAIRNRGTLRGCYGLYATHKESEQTWAIARRVWAQSATNDITMGATHWGTDADVKTGTYIGLKPTVTIGAHHFFKK